MEQDETTQLGQPDRLDAGTAADLELHALALSRSHLELQRSLEEVETHMGRLQRRLQALLRSRRWRVGHAIAHSVDRISVRRQEEDPEAGMLLMVREGERLLNRAKERGTVNIRTRFLRDLDVQDPLKTYMRQAMLQPTLSAPFSAHGTKVLEFMAGETDRRVALSRLPGDLPAVSILMPTYNRAGVIGRAIDSVIAQTHPDWELIIVDDGSSDATESVVNGYDDTRIRLITLARNAGVSAARNQALAQARHEVITYLDSDNYWDSEYLRVVAGAYRDHPDRSCAYTAQTLVSESHEGDDHTTLGIRYTPFHRGLLENRNYVDLNCFSHRKQVVEDLGDFDTSLPRLVDWELVLRITAKHRPMTIPCPLSNYVFGAVDDQLTHRFSSKQATRQLDRALFGPQTVKVKLPDDARRVHRTAVFRPGLHALGTTLSRPLSIVVIDEGRGWARPCLQTLLDGQQDLKPVRLLLDGPALDFEELHSRLRVDPVVMTAGMRLDQVIRRLDLDGQTDLLLLSSDVMVMPGAVGQLQTALISRDDLGLVIPRRTILPDTDSYAAHVDHYKADRELDIALSAAHRNIVDPHLDDTAGYIGISYSPIFCALIAADLAPGLLLGDPVRSGDGPLSRQLFDSVRVASRRRAAYVPSAKTYHLI